MERGRYASARVPQSQRSRQRVESRLLELVPAITLFFIHDNFHVALHDAYKVYQEWVTGVAQVIICAVYMAVKLYEFPEDSPLYLALKSLSRLPTWPANSRIYRDTAVIVIISYMLLLDINLSYLWLSIFPIIVIVFICALCIEFCPPGEEDELAESSNGYDYTTTPGSQKALQAMAAVPFLALLVMAQLDDITADRFAISQFLLFMSTTLGALTYMMMRLPVGKSPGVAPASELLHKAFLLLLLVTVHTVAAEAMGEDVVLVCLPEVVLVLLWFCVHLDRDSSIICIDKIKPHKIFLIASVIVPLAYLATSMDGFGLSICTTSMVACGVSGILTYYVVFMLHQWPPGQQSAVKINVIAEMHLGEDKGASASSEVAVQSEGQAGSAEEAVKAVKVLKFWANVLLIVAAALLLLKYVVAWRLGLQEPLLDTLCRDFRLCR